VFCGEITFGMGLEDHIWLKRSQKKKNYRNIKLVKA
jgi:hypothetical protein